RISHDDHHEEPAPAYVLDNHGINLLKWREAMINLRVHHRAEITTQPNTDIFSLFPKKLHKLFSRAEIFQNEHVRAWIFKVTDRIEDLDLSLDNFRAIQREARQTISFHAMNDYTIDQNEADTVASELARTCERIPIDLYRLSREAMARILRSTISSVLKSRPDLVSKPSILLMFYGEHRKPYIQVNYLVLELSDLGTSQGKRLKSCTFAIFPDMIYNDTDIPPPHPIFYFKVTNDLINWVPKPTVLCRQPTKVQMEKGIALMKHILSEVGLHGVDKPGVTMIVENIKARFCLRVEGNTILTSPALLYRGAPLFDLLDIRATKGTCYLVPSKEVQEDIDVQLPPIPEFCNSTSSHRISSAIESAWMETGIEDAWEAGCRAFNTINMGHSNISAYFPSQTRNSL
ncbi:MAG: hypothetical protein ACRYGR_01900, partial [Janthinobacterium lividum]